MRKGQSVIWTWVPIALALTFTVLLALLVGFYSITGDVGWSAAGGGTVLAVGCYLAEPCGAAVTAIGAGTAAFGGATLLSGGGDTIGGQIGDAADVRATGMLPHLLMAADSTAGGQSIGSRIKECVYRESVLGGSCSYSEFQDDASAVIRDRAFQIEVTHDGSTVLSAESGDLGPKSRASYSMIIPVKGGKTATLVIHVQGRPGGVWWTR